MGGGNLKVHYREVIFREKVYPFVFAFTDEAALETELQELIRSEGSIERKINIKESRARKASDWEGKTKERFDLRRGFRDSPVLYLGPIEEPIEHEY